MIRVSDAIKARLALVKGNSFETRIELMLDYFDATGADPAKRIANPIFEVERQVERVVKILRNIENKKINNILKILETHDFSVVKNEGSEAAFTAEELEKIEAIGEELKTKDKEILVLEEALKKTNMNPEKIQNKDKTKTDFQAIKTIMNDLFESKRNTEIEANSFLINKNIFLNSQRKISSIVDYYVR